MADVLSALADLQRRLAMIEVELRAVAEAEQTRCGYLKAVTDTMRRAADTK